MSSINSITTNLQQLITQQLNYGASVNLGNNVTGTATGDSNQVSELAQLLNTLQQLQSTNPTKYAQVTQQISTNLQSAAQTAQQQGNSSTATELNQLANVFEDASQSGQAPSALAAAAGIGGSGGHHHHHHGAPPATSSTSSTDQTTDQTTNPLTIISNTLTSAGVTT